METKVYLNKDGELVIDRMKLVLNKEETKLIVEALNGEIIKNDVENYPKEPGFYWCTFAGGSIYKKRIIVEIIEDEEGNFYFVRGDMEYNPNKGSDWSNKIVEDKK